MFKPKLFYTIKKGKKELTNKQLMQDIIAGIIVAIIALPLSVALAISSGVSPEKGLITAVIAGFVISFLGGSNVQIGGPTGAFVVIVYGIVEKYGIEGLTIATIMAGIFLVIFGLLRFGSLIKYIPYPIITGFTAGIAVTLFSTQIKDFLGLGINKVPSEFIPKWHCYLSNLSTINWITFALGVISLLIIILWPKVNKSIPGSLVALIVATLAAFMLKLPVATIGSTFGELSSKIPAPHLVPINLTTIKELIHPAITIAILAGIESLLSAVVADGMIGKKHDSNMELVAQGVANVASALFGGIPATGAIARTAANIKNGGRTPIAGIVHAITLFLIMVLFMPLAKFIPLTTLGAILIVVSYNMSGWRTFKDLLKSTKSDVTTLLVTFIFTVVFDLVIAIEIGMIIAMAMFIKRMSETTEIINIKDDCDDMFDDDNILDKINNEGIIIYEINGPLFFGAAQNFMEIINEIKSSSDILILRMRNVPNMDATAFDALKRIEERCRMCNITLLLSGVQEQPRKLLYRMGFAKKIGQEHIFSNIEDALNSANEIIEERDSLTA